MALAYPTAGMRPHLLLRIVVTLNSAGCPRDCCVPCLLAMCGRFLYGVRWHEVSCHSTQVLLSS